VSSSNHSDTNNHNVCPVAIIQIPIIIMCVQ